MSKDYQIPLQKVYLKYQENTFLRITYGVASSFIRATIMRIFSILHILRNFFFNLKRAIDRTEFSI